MVWLCLHRRNGFEPALADGEIMVETAANTGLVRTLAASIVADGPWPTERALGLTAQVADHLTALHAAGVFHGAISIDSITVDSKCQAGVSPRDAACRVGNAEDLEWTHPLLRGAQPTQLPTDLPAAVQALSQVGLQLDPREIDIYKLGAVLCRLITGDALDTYLRSPRTKAKVPEVIRPLFDKLGSSLSEFRFRTVEEFAAAIQSAQSTLRDASPEFHGDLLQGGLDNQSAGYIAAEQDTSGIFHTNQPAPDTSIGVPAVASALHPLANDAAKQSPLRAQPRDGDDLPFQQLGHYQILGRIGCGGMGDVYRAYEVSLDRVVAIKVLPADLARQAEFVRRFRAEATAAARLVHPNIIQIYFIGEDSGHHFFAMQYVDGESLADMLGRRGSLTVDETVAVMSQVLAGLVVAHQKGMVHRDIKPGNVLLDRIHQRALLADFGLVKSASTTEGQTATGIVMGTVDYIAPEQARAQAIDSRADLYSLGVLMHQMLCGQLPFQGESPTAVMFQHVYDIPMRVDVIKPEIPAPLASVVAKLLEKSPDHRYQTADEILIDLRAFREGRELPGLTPGPPRAKVDRHTAILTLPWFHDLQPVPEISDAAVPLGWWGRLRGRALSILRVQAPGVLAQLQNTQQQLNGAIREYERRRATLQKLVAEAQSILKEFESQANAYRAASVNLETDGTSASRAGLLEANADGEDFGRVATELDQKAAEQREQLEAMSLRLGQVDATLQQLQSQQAILVARLAAAHAKVRVSGGRTTGRRRYKVAILACSVVIVAPFLILRFLPDVWDGVKTRSIDLFSAQVPFANQNRKLVTPPPPTQVAAGTTLVAAKLGQVSAGDSKLSYILACLFDNGMIRISPIVVTENRSRKIKEAAVNLEGTQTFKLDEAKGTAIAVSPDGNNLAVAGDDHAVHIWNIAEKRESRRLPATTDKIVAMQFSLDGARLISAAQKGMVLLWDIQQERELKRLEIDRKWNTDEILDIGWAADEHRFIVGMGGHAVGRTIRAWSLDSDREIQIFGSQARHTTGAVVFGPEPYAASLTNGKISLWDMQTGTEVRSTGDYLLRAAFSQDARHALALGKNQYLKVWNIRNGTLADALPLVNHEKAQLAISPDGQMGAAVSPDGTVQVWPLPAPSPDGQIAQFKIGHPVQSVAFSPDSDGVASGSDDDLHVWVNPSIESFVRSFRMAGRIPTITFSADGEKILYGTGMRNAKTNWMGVRITRQDVKDYLRDIRRYNVEWGEIVSAVYHPDGSRVISACANGTIGIWSSQAETELSHFEIGMPMTGMAISPSGAEILIAAADNNVRLWNLQAGKEVRQFAGHTFHVLSVAIAADGRTAVSGAKDRTVRTWDLATGTALQRFAGHNGYVTSVAISGDGRFVLSGSDDNTVRLWDAETGENLRTFDGHVAPVRSVQISPDGNRGLSGSDDGTMRIWDVRIPVSAGKTAIEGTGKPDGKGGQP